MAILTPSKTTWLPRHLLLIGNTKAGKTRYVVEAIRDGYECLYADADNGLATIQAALSDSPEAFKRLHYFAPADLETFLADLLTAGTFRYNETRRQVYDGTNSAPTDSLCEILPARIPPRVILCVDSWTALSYRGLKNQAARKSIDLQDVEKYTREIYGGSGFQLTQIASIIQAVRFGVIVIAHGANYERKQRPPGRVDAILEKDMIIVDTTIVPISSSLPHGFTLGKHFNEIANLYVKPVSNAREIDYTVKADRISGGTVNFKGDPMQGGRYATLFGKPSAPSEDEPNWIRYLTVAELKEQMAAAKANAVPSKMIPQPAVKAGSIVPASPKPAAG